LQYLVTSHNAKAKTFELQGKEAHHLAIVLRKKPGDVIRLFDGKDQVFWGVIERVFSQEITGRIVESSPDRYQIPKLPYEIYLYQALPKGAKWDWVLEKCTELGVERFIPIVSARTIPKIEAKELPKKMSRWRKVLEAAAKQCGVLRIPEIEEPKSFREVLSMIFPSPLGGEGRVRGSNLFLFAWESELANPIWEVLNGVPKPQRVSIFIGPEGGWTTEEAELAKKEGLIPVGLGPTVLRAETAGIVAISMAIACLK